MSEKRKLLSEDKIKELEELCILMADDRKAENIVSLKMTELSVLADYFILCTAGSEPHLKAVANHIVKEVRERLDIRPRAVDGVPESKWVIIDYGAVLVHIMEPETRELYQLESLWGDAPRTSAVEILEKASAKSRER